MIWNVVMHLFSQHHLRRCHMVLKETVQFSDGVGVPSVTCFVLVDTSDSTWLVPYQTAAQCI